MLLSLGLNLIQASAQQIAPVKVPGIPHSLVWENKPLSFSQGNGTLIIEAGEKTDMFRDPNVTYNTDNAPKLLFEPDSNFVLIASISHDFLNKWDAGALVLKSDSLHWVKFCFEKDYTGVNRVVSVVTKGVSDDSNAVSIKAKKVFYKIAKAGNVITLYYALNGKDWFLIRHFQFESGKKLSLGFLAQSPTGKNCRVTFADIHYEAKRIKDPYAGE
jgi:regulation of enolase protein 1 (concanavalin A-like superfamily)